MYISHFLKKQRLLTKLIKRNCSVKNFSVTSSILADEKNISDNYKIKLGIIGIGKIAQAITIGLINNHILSSSQIYGSDMNIQHLNFVKNSEEFQNYKINFCERNEDVINNSNVLLISVKPSDVIPLLKTISPKLKDDHLILSIAAGIQLKNIRNMVSPNIRVIRIMTNIAALYQQACSVYSKAINCTADDARTVEILLNSIGTCEGEINEDLIDVVTALSGSGPAYMCSIIDSLADGAVRMGLDKKIAIKLTIQTMFGTSFMLKNGKNIHYLKDDVSCPGGTTIHGLCELEKHKLRYTMIKCIEKATKRAKELNELKQVI